MAETIKKHFAKRNFYKQIAEFDNNLFIFDNWNGSVVENLFLEKVICNLLKSLNFLKFDKK